ncbi:MAG: signal peptidase II [Demequina sp.]
MTWRPALWLVALAVIALDQATKQWALTALAPGERLPVIGDLLSLQLVFNSGAAFSLGEGYTWVMTIIAVIVTIGIVYFARRAQSRLSVALLGIGLGGAVGNLIDRLAREPGFGQGHVVDMINYNGWFVGNVADLAIVGVAAVVLVMSITNRPLLAPEPDRAVQAHPAEASAGEETRG